MKKRSENWLRKHMPSTDNSVFYIPKKHTIEALSDGKGYLEIAFGANDHIDAGRLFQKLIDAGKEVEMSSPDACGMCIVRVKLVNAKVKK